MLKCHRKIAFLFSTTLTLSALFFAAFASQQSLAIAKIDTVDGTISPDLEGNPYIELTIVIANITDIELTSIKADADTTYLGRIEVILPDSDTGHYIQTASGDGLPDNNHGFYWDKSATTSGTLQESYPDGHSISYTLTIRENPNAVKPEKLSDLLKTTGTIKGIKVEPVFFPTKDTAGKLQPIAGTPLTYTIEQNFALPNEFPPGLTAGGTYKSLAIKWTATSKIDYSDKKERSAPAVVLIIAKNSGGAQIELDAAALITSGKGDAPTEGSCTLTPPENPGDSCITCKDETNTYLDLTKLKAIPGMELSRSVANKGEASIAGVEDEQSYTVAIQYTNGLKRSECYNASSNNNITMLELNGAKPGKPEDLRCFIATAAFGSVLDPHVKMFRWFRDRFLTTHAIGQSIVDTYYRLSPSLARLIAENDTLRFIARTVLLPIAGVLYLCKWISEHLNFLYAGLFLTVLFAVVALRIRNRFSR